MTVEIRCKRADRYLWAAGLDYGDHRFYRDLEQSERIQLRLHSRFIPAEALNAPPRTEESLRQEAELAAVNKTVAEENQRKREAEALAKAEQVQAKKRKRAEELPPFRAQLKLGDRVRVVRRFGSHSETTGVVVEVRRPLALLQAETRSLEGTVSEMKWISIEELEQFD